MSKDDLKAKIEKLCFDEPDDLVDQLTQLAEQYRREGLEEVGKELVRVRDLLPAQENPTQYSHAIHIVEQALKKQQ